MKRHIVRLPAVLCLAVLLVSLLSVSALAAGGGSSDVSFLDRMYDWFASTFASIATYFTAVVYSITDSPAPFVKFAVLFGALALVLAALIILVASIFKRRFFRTLAGLAMAAVLLWTATLVPVLLKALDSGLPFFESCNIAFYRAMPKVYLVLEPLVDHHVALLAGIFFSTVLSVLLISWLFILTVNHRKAMRLARSKAALDERLDEILALEEQSRDDFEERLGEILVLERGGDDLEEPLAEPAAEQEPEDAPAAEEDGESAEEIVAIQEEEADGESAEEIAAIQEEEADGESEDAEGEAELPTYPLLDEPVFMPVPSTVFDTVDFTDASRDGYEVRCGISADEAKDAMSDELAEDLTAFVYRQDGGVTAEIGLDCLNANFKEYAYIDARILRILGLIPENARRIAVVASGTVDKPLMIEATEISLDAVKMITLAGGRAIRVLA